MHLRCLLLGMSLLVAFFQGFGQWEMDYSPMASQSSRLDSVFRVIQGNHEAQMATVDAKKQKLLHEALSMRFKNTKEKIDKGYLLTDPATDAFLHRILREIFRGNPTLPQKDLRILLSCFPWPNASQLGDGTILLNAGLLSHLENESQLAFVICHEIAHYVLDHVNGDIRKRIALLESKATKEQLAEIQRTEYGARSKAIALLKEISYDARRHSRVHEIAADSLALELLLHTAYDARQAVACLGIMDAIDQEDSSDLHLDQVFASKDLPFNPAWLRVESTGFGYVETKSEFDEDSLKTHPDCAHRITRLVPRLEGYEWKSKEVNPIPAFEAMKLRSRFESVKGHFTLDDIGKCLYAALRLRQTYPDNAFLNGLIGLCFNQMHAAQKNHELGKYVAIPDTDLPKQYNLVLNFIHNLKLSEVAKVGYYFLQNHGGATASDYQLYAWWGSCKIMGDVAGQGVAKDMYLTQFPKGRFLTQIQSQ